jgi:uncharacterized protein (TIGR02271 family)
MAQTNQALTRMSETDDYRVAQDDLDIRGWTVSTLDGQNVGRVTDLIIDPSAMKVRYLEVALTGAAPSAADGGVLVPIEAVHLERSVESVVIEGLAIEQLRTLPRYGAATTGSASVTDDYPRQGRDGDTRRLTRAEEELRIGKRAVETGQVRVGKHVETEHVTTPVTLAKERVTVERRPVSEATGQEVRIGEDGEIVVPIMEEEAVIEKRAVVKEELVINKQRITETETVETDVRKEQFDIDSTDPQVLNRGGQ